jgi:hypothetical protein
VIRRARLISVLTILLAGVVILIGSTQTWLSVVLADGAAEALPVPGASAVPVLAPLSLAGLALGAALSIVGPGLRYVFGVIGLAIGVLLAVWVAPIVFAAPVSAVVSTVTPATGIAGVEGVEALVASITPTPWPAVTLAATVLLIAAAIFTLTTARRWTRGAGRKYTTAEATAAAGPAASRPHDAIDSWDDLSRGDDPTA